MILVAFVRRALTAGLLIEILGREDAQVKINGFRVELGEIDRVLERNDGVASAVTIVHNRTLLSSYVVLASGVSEDELTPEQLQHACSLSSCFPI